MSAHNKEPNYRLRQAAAATLAAVALGGIIGGAKLMDNGDSSKKESTVQLDIEKKPVLLNAQVILSESVNLRTSPNMDNKGSQDPNDNIAGAVKKGEILVLNSPLVYQNHANETWYGFTDKEKDVYWVNATGLMEEQDRTGNTLMRVIEDQNVGGRETQTGVFQDGEFFYGQRHGGRNWKCNACKYGR